MDDERVILELTEEEREIIRESLLRSAAETRAWGSFVVRNFGGLTGAEVLKQSKHMLELADRFK